MKYTSTPFLGNFGVTEREFLRQCPSCPNYLPQRHRGNRPVEIPFYPDKYRTEPSKFRYNRAKKKRKPKCRAALQSVSCPQRLEQIAQPTMRHVVTNIHRFGRRWETDRLEKTLKLYNKIAIPCYQAQFQALSQPTLPSYKSSPRFQKKRKAQRKGLNVPKSTKTKADKDQWLDEFTRKMASEIFVHVLRYHRSPTHRHVRLGLKLNEKLHIGKMFHIRKDVRIELERYCILLAQVADALCQPYKQTLRVEEILKSASSEDTLKENKHCVFNLRDYYGKMVSEEVIIEEEEEDDDIWSYYEPTPQSLSEASEEVWDVVPAKRGFTVKRTHYIRTMKITESLIEGSDEFLDIYIEIPMSPPSTPRGKKVYKIIHRIYDKDLQEQLYFEEDGKIRKVTTDRYGNQIVTYHLVPGKIKPGYLLVNEERHILNIDGINIPLLIQHFRAYQIPEDVPIFEEELEIMGIAGEVVPESETEGSLFDDDTALTCNMIVPLPRVTEKHDENAVSYVEVSLYMSWLNEFGNNITCYKTCLTKFKSVLTAENNAQYVGTIARILQNWGNYLKDSRMVDQSMAEYFRNKRIQTCCRCRRCSIDDYPMDHEVNRELRLAIRTTKVWRSLLRDAEVYCNTLKGAEDESEGDKEEDEATVETEEREEYVQITDVTSSDSSEFDIIELGRVKT